MSFASSIKKVFLHERYGRADAIPRHLIEQFADTPKLAGMLPYVGWMPSERMFIVDQGGFGKKEQFSDISPNHWYLIKEGEGKAQELHFNALNFHPAPEQDQTGKHHHHH